jgi:hypothetical protein
VADQETQNHVGTPAKQSGNVGLIKRIYRKIFAGKTEEEEEDQTNQTVYRQTIERYKGVENALKAYRKTRVGLEENIAEKETCYRLVMTDIIVEKALKRLEEQASIYHGRGRFAYGVGIVFIFFAIICAGFQTLLPEEQQRIIIASFFNIQVIPKPPVEPIERLWIDLLGKFMRGFTFYGLLVLAAVKTWHFSKAMLDQAERLFERRHAVRQGKLYVHLRGGEIKSIEEMEKAFGWNLEQPNAFAGIATDAKAPWGSFLADYAKTMPELAKTVPALVKTLKKAKKSEKTKKSVALADKNKKDVDLAAK